MIKSNLRSGRIALLGVWPKGSKEEFFHAFEVENGISTGLEFVSSFPPDDSVLGESLVESDLDYRRMAYYFQEHSLAKSSDFVIFGNSGKWGGKKSNHLQSLGDNLLIWTPKEINEKMPEDGFRPGVIFFQGDTEELASFLSYLVSFAPVPSSSS